MTVASNPNDPVFYVYVMVDPRKPGHYDYGNGQLVLPYEPFYIGKGKGERYKSHHLRSSNRVKNKINSILKKTGKSHKVRILKRNLTEEQAYCLETKVIKGIGLLLTGKGPLLNMNEGGPGVQQGFVSSETKARRAKSLRRYWAKMRSDKEAYDSRKSNMGRRPFTEKEKEEQSQRKISLYASPEGKKLKRRLRKATIAVAKARTPAHVKRIYDKARATRLANKLA